MREKPQNSHIPAFKLEYVVMVILAVVVFFINFGMIGDCYSPFAFNDEMGYWMHAAEMAGLDWTGVSDTVWWYSYGYSLLLVPLIKIFHDTVILYRAALVLNLLMDVGCYFMFIYIIRRLFPKIELITASAVAAAGILYTSYQMNAAIAWSETALLTAVTAVILMAVKVLSKPTYLNIAVFGILNIYMFTVHNRTIGIVASAILIMILAVVCKKVTYKQFGVFASALAIGFIADRIIKAQLVKALWKNGPNGNDAGSVAGNLKEALSSGEGLRRLIGVMAGNCFAISVGTLCLGLFVMIIIVRRGAVGFYHARKAIKSGKKLSEVTDSKFLVFMFIFCAFVSTYLISSIFLLEFNRVDHIVYTRYCDVFAGILIMTGICFMFEAEKSDIMAAMFIPFIMRLCISRINYMMTLLEEPIFNRICAPSISQLHANNGLNFNAYLTYSVSWFFVLLLVVSLFKWKKLGIFLCAAVCIGLFWKNSPEAKEVIWVAQNEYLGDRALCQRVSELPEKQIYVMSDEGTFISFLQYEMKDTRVELVDSPEDVTGDGYLFVSISKDELEDFGKIDSSDRHSVYLIE
ncbi:hypothetical protein [Ruminococcus sp.]|uniref:hypothetical protein n=1 Tax=Ruminococcus sp. TaxID=41978 RepID=UPI0025DE5E32|nr:hypothetical protein [Ruminococcus sp.]